MISISVNKNDSCDGQLTLLLELNIPLVFMLWKIRIFQIERILLAWPLVGAASLLQCLPELLIFFFPATTDISSAVSLRKKFYLHQCNNNQRITHLIYTRKRRKEDYHVNDSNTMVSCTYFKQ